MARGCVVDTATGVGRRVGDDVALVENQPTVRAVPNAAAGSRAIVLYEATVGHCDDTVVVHKPAACVCNSVGHKDTGVYGHLPAGCIVKPAARHGGIGNERTGVHGDLSTICIEQTAAKVGGRVAVDEAVADDNGGDTIRHAGTVTSAAGEP